MDDFADLKIVLASGSAVRGKLLRRAGVAFSTLSVPDAVERDEKYRFQREQAAADAKGEDRASPPAARLAARLALAKADHASRKCPNNLVVGVDQTLEIDGRTLDKAADRRQAEAQLSLLQGRTHRLCSAFVCLRDGENLAAAAASAHLTMRPLSASQRRAYLDAVGDEVFGSVGVYRLEELGIRLFSAVEGDYFTILGLPLTLLLEALETCRRQAAGMNAGKIRKQTGDQTVSISARKIKNK